MAVLLSWGREHCLTSTSVGIEIQAPCLGPFGTALGVGWGRIKVCRYSLAGVEVWVLHSLCQSEWGWGHGVPRVFHWRRAIIV